MKGGDLMVALFIVMAIIGVLSVTTCMTSLVVSKRYDDKIISKERLKSNDHIIHSKLS